MSEDHPETLNIQMWLAAGLGALGRPQEGIRLVLDALEKGEKTGELERNMKQFRFALVGPSNA